MNEILVIDNIIKQTGADPDKVKEYFEKVIAPSFGIII